MFLGCLCRCYTDNTLPCQHRITRNTVSDVRRVMPKAKPKKKLGRPPLADGPLELHAFRLSAKDKLRVLKAAQRDGVSFSEWVRRAIFRILDEAGHAEE